MIYLRQNVIQQKIKYVTKKHSYIISINKVMIFYNIKMLNIYFHIFVFKKQIELPARHSNLSTILLHKVWRFKKWVDTKWRQTYAVFISERVSLSSCGPLQVGLWCNIPAPVHHDRPIVGCPPDSVVVQERRPPAFTSSVHPIKPCHRRSLQASCTAIQASMQRRSRIYQYS